MREKKKKQIKEVQKTSTLGTAHRLSFSMGNSSHYVYHKL